MLQNPTDILTCQPRMCHSAKLLPTSKLQYSELSQLKYSDKLLDQASNIVSTCYPNSSNSASSSNLVSLKSFIRDFLKSTHTTFSTLQLALFLLVKLYKNSQNTSFDFSNSPVFKCGRRMFLSSLIIASKVILEPSPQNIAWAKLSRLPINELNNAERMMLIALDHNLNISGEDFMEWGNLLLLPKNEFLSMIELP